MGKVILAILRSEWDRAAALAALAVGVAAMINGWVGVSGTAYSAEQMPYVVGGGLLGIFLLGVAAVLWLSADLRDEWRELWMIRDALVRLAAGQSVAAGGSIAAWFDDISGADDDVVAAGGSRRRRADERS